MQRHNLSGTVSSTALSGNEKSVSFLPPRPTTNPLDSVLGGPAVNLAVSLLSALPDAALYCRAALGRSQEAFVQRAAMSEPSVRTPHFRSLVQPRKSTSSFNYRLVDNNAPDSGESDHSDVFSQQSLVSTSSSTRSGLSSASSFARTSSDEEEDCCSPARTQFYEERNPRFRLYTAFDGKPNYPAYIGQLIAYFLRVGLLPSIPNQVLISQFLHPEHNRPVSKPTCGDYMLAVMMGSHTVIDLFPTNMMSGCTEHVQVLMQPGSALLLMGECFRNVPYGINAQSWDVMSRDEICNLQAAGDCEGMRLERRPGVLITMIGESAGMCGQ